MRGDNCTLLEAAAVIRRRRVRRAAGPLLRKCLPLAMRARGEKKEKGKESENGVFILPGCEAPPSPVMAGAPRKKCLLPFNDGEDGGQRAAREAQKGNAGAVGGDVSPPPPPLLPLLRNGRALAQRCIR